MGDGVMGCAGGLGMMGLGLLLVILLFVIVGYLAYRFGQSTGPRGAGGAVQTRSDEALEAARARYARGEIGREEFERLKRDLL
ncbi:MAG: SHOCT domain-containing protein [Trueperaceae bacterium]